MLRAPTLVSLFTGAGGLDLGLESAGFECVAATDADPLCIETLSANQATGIPVHSAHGRCFLEGARIVHSAVEALDEPALAPAGVGKSWRPDLLAGGPPCQPFSSSGKQFGFDDPRGRLFEHFVRLAAALRPRYILFENVRGLVTARGPSGGPGQALSLVREAFERIGYGTRFSILNAADFGVPQRRIRLFMLGACEGPLPGFPDPTHSDRPDPRLFERKAPWVSLGEFLASRPAPDPAQVIRPTPALAAYLRHLPEGSGLRSAGARERTRPGGHWGYRQGTFIADLARPARTVTASTSQDWVRIDGSLRRLTDEECSGLQGFPSAWTFAGNRAARLRQVGNAVPTTLGRVIGAKIVESLHHPTVAGRPASEPFPSDFVEAVEYTRREDERNGQSRRSVRRLQERGGVERSLLKGLGSWESKDLEGCDARSRRHPRDSVTP